MENVTNDYLLDKKIKMFQSTQGYKTSSDAVLLSAFVESGKEDMSVLDVGSGTGGVSLCLAYRFKKASITGFEIQPELAELAKMSAKENGFENLKYLICDIRQKKMPLPFCSFDCVVTNPPYASNGSKSPNASKAMAHNQQDIDLKGWIGFCLKMLKPFGKLYLIHRAEALDEVLRALDGKAGNIEILPIYSKKQDKAKRILVKAQKDSKSPLKILMPFIVHDDKGYTLQAEAVLRKGKTIQSVLESI